MVEPITLSPEEGKSLRLQARRAVGRVSERIHYVLLFARGYAVKEIAALYQVDDLTVASWLKRYREGGVGGLDDLPRSGRPPVASGAARAEVTQCLDGTPAAAGVERTSWTRRLMQRHLGERFGCYLSRASMTRLIGVLGFVWTRPKLIVKEGDPEAGPRMAAITAALAAHPEAPRLYEDECDLAQLPVVRGQYQRRGQQREIATPGQNKKQAVFGFLDVLTGEWHYFLTPNFRPKWS